jgi:hypothetical protein
MRQSLSTPYLPPCLLPCRLGFLFPFICAPLLFAFCARRHRSTCTAGNEYGGDEGFCGSRVATAGLGLLSVLVSSSGSCYVNIVTFYHDSDENGLARGLGDLQMNVELMRS